MRFSVVVISLAAAITTVNGFLPVAHQYQSSSSAATALPLKIISSSQQQQRRWMSSSATTDTDTDEATTTTPCDMPSNTDIPESVTAKNIRSAVLTNVDGDRIKLGDVMGRGTSVVVFLRHLG